MKGNVILFYSLYKQIILIMSNLQIRKKKKSIHNYLHIHSLNILLHLTKYYLKKLYRQIVPNFKIVSIDQPKVKFDLRRPSALIK